MNVKDRNELNIIQEYKHPVLFYVLSIAISWLFWFLAGYISWVTPFEEKYLQIASILAFLGLLSPLGVVYLLTKNNRILRKDISSRFFNIKNIKSTYLLLACLIMPISITIAQTISLLFGYSPDQFLITGNFSFDSGIFPVWFLLIIAPLIEELAWHSYGTDSLHSKFNLFNTSIIFGIMWGIWHMPLSTIRDYYQNNLVNEGLIYSINFLVSIIPFVLLMNWLYYKTGRNILIVIIFHITAGFFNELFAPHPDTKIIQTILLILLAIIVIIKEKTLFFEKKPYLKDI